MFDFNYIRNTGHHVRCLNKDELVVGKTYVGKLCSKKFNWSIAVWDGEKFVKDTELHLMKCRDFCNAFPDDYGCNEGFEKLTEIRPIYYHPESAITLDFLTYGDIFLPINVRHPDMSHVDCLQYVLASCFWKNE